MKKALLLVAMLCVAIPAAAQTKILETATFSANNAENVFIGYYGYGYNLQYRLMASFHLDSTTTVTSVGLANAWPADGGGANNELYAAIIRVQPNLLPATYPYSASDVVAGTTFVPAGGDQTIPLSATLSPGDYAVLFTAGPNNTGGAAYVGGVGQSAIGTPFVRASDDYNTTSWVDPTATVWNSPPLRIVVEGISEHQEILNTVNTRASQTSVDALTSTVGTLATQQSLTNLGTSIGNAFAALTGVVNGDAGQTNNNMAAFSSSVSGQFSNLFSSVNTLSGGATVGQVASMLSTKANDSSVVALGGQVSLLSGQVTTLGSSLTGLATAADVNAAAMTVSGAVSTRASQSSVDAIATSLGGSNDAAVRLQIEQDLATGQRLVTFLTPASAGGKLDVVRDVVLNALSEAQSAGLNVTKAQSWFSKGDTAAGAGNYATAYDDYASAYQALIK